MRFTQLCNFRQNMVAVITTKHLVDLLTSKAQVDPPHRPKVDSHSERGDEQSGRQAGKLLTNYDVTAAFQW